ncbi:MAG: hypothetical protein BRC36_04020 [Cyanobacteria bacterium QH_2_48_84]|nr:MAG: hypothetical protein BRC36_04020 [Cyanobacteria bacterium QH_2_48_84]
MLALFALFLVRLKFVVDGVGDVSISAVFQDVVLRVKAGFDVGGDADIESVGRDIGVPDDIDASFGWK